MRVFIGYPSFMAYQMMKGKKGNNDGFPSVTGMIARYSALGLTNEQMAENPVWKDLTGNGHDLQMKNFAWGGMSGVGGYNQNFNQWGYGNLPPALQTYTPHKVELNIPSTLKTGNIYSNLGKEGDIYDFTLKIVGLKDGASLRITKGVVSGNIEKIKKDGIYKIYQPLETSWDQLRIYIVISNPNLVDLNITIEQLPLYPGFILGDGVDDFAVTEKELNFEDTYTVYTAFIPFQVDPVRAMEMCGKDFKKDFYLYYSNTHVVYYTSGLNNYIPVRINQFHIIVCKRNKTNAVIKNLITGESKTFSVSELIDNPGVYYLWRHQRSGTSTAKTAIAGQTICNGYFSTDEDDEKVLNWYKKQYPWLFPDQAWTVVGKTNEDEDRATIANITGNGNDLVLSNFGFAEGSGYGLYAYNFNSFALRGNVVKPTDVKKDSFRIIGIGDKGNILVLSNVSNSADWKIRITGMKDGDHLLAGNANKSGDYIKITKDGVYTFQKQYAANATNGIWYNSSQEVDVLVEQIPEYEGYLITDGVDDKVQSSSFTMNEDWTIVGDWELLSNVQINCGIVKAQNVYLYNTANGLLISINNPRSLQSFGTKSLHAICSDGRLYDRNWVEYEYTVDQNFEIVESSLNIGFNLNNYTQIAFKNLGIYNDQLLSKDDCIKAYNYLQTLKAK